MMWIPLRSPKMYSFILGFQRRVWWPKCTPASSSSFMVISTATVPPYWTAACGRSRGRTAFLPASLPAVISPRRPFREAAAELVPGPAAPASPERLSLGELESLSGALLPVLLALLHPRIPGQEAVLAQRRPELGVETGNGARKSHAHRARLPAGAAPVRRHHHF